MYRLAVGGNASGLAWCDFGESVLLALTTHACRSISHPRDGTDFASDVLNAPSQDEVLATLQLCLYCVANPLNVQVGGWKGGGGGIAGVVMWDVGREIILLLSMALQPPVWSFR